MEATAIGTVEILRLRIYPLDPESRGDFATEVVVEPQTCVLYKMGITRYWMMTGRVNMRETRLGDGMFTIGGSDRPEGPTVTFPSRFYGPDELAALVNDPTVEGRLKITIDMPLRTAIQASNTVPDPDQFAHVMDDDG